MILSGLMPRAAKPGGFQRGAAADLWRHTLSQIPTVFGRLVYLSSLRDPNSGRYEHFGLAQAYGEGQAHQTLAESHQSVFRQWLSFNLEQQKADLECYLESLGGDRRVILETWSRVAPYRNLVPAAVGNPERRLYLADLETVLELLKSECGVACPDPDA